MPSDSSLPAVGFIGVGNMGSVMSRHILASGRTVIGWDRAPAALEALAKAGGEVAGRLSDVAAAPVVISMVIDDRATREITLGPDGLVDAMRPGAIHVVMSTIPPTLSRELSEAHASKGQHYLAASVFGQPPAAAAAQLLVNCSGPFAAFEAVKPILAVMGSVRWIGSEPEQAMLVKLMGNSMIYTSVEIMREMFMLLRAGGISEADAKEILVDTLLPGSIAAGYAQQYVDDPASTEAKPIGGKITQACVSAGESMNVDLPLVRFLTEHALR
jgi:3-hydroxyisobutyrate dehydrogenase-like beta-hydroxyacid dehydrogenase